MPKEINVDDFMKLKEKASKILVFWNGDRSKIKLRTKRVLYTLVTSEEKVNELIKGVKAEVIEIGKQKAKEQ